MYEAVNRLAMYLHLARASEARQRLHVRDRLLVIAAVLAARGGLPRIAAYCRRRILEHNPQHLIQRWDSVFDAAGDPEFAHFLRHIERRYPPEKAEQMMESLGLTLGHERQTYYSDEEYAAALLGVTADELEEMFGSA